MNYIILVLILTVSLFIGEVQAQWIAYNDCLPETGDFTAANVTGWTIHNGDLTHFTGRLKDFESGEDTGMPVVTFNMSDAGLRVSNGSAGGNPAQGTDAYEIFGGIVDFGPNNIYYGDPGWWVEIEFTGLDPDKTYNFAGTAIRARSYPGRISLFTISDAVSFINNSSEGIFYKNRAETKLIAGDNSLTGYVVRWDDIVPSTGGSFKIRAEATPDSDGGMAYPFSGFMLEEVSINGNQPPEVDAGNYDSLIWPEDVLRLAPFIEDDDPCGYGILTVKWSQLSGPDSVTFYPSDEIADPCAVFPGPGDYVLGLQAWDELEQEGSGSVVIIVLPTDWQEQRRQMLVINELLAKNALGVTDPQGEYDDWLEIYNKGRESLDIGGMYLTDDPSESTLWLIPDNNPSLTTIPPGGYLLIWADNDVTDTGLHAGFGLNADGGEVYLFDADGVTVMDSVEYGKQVSDISYGRDPDGIDNWVTLSPTPGTSNTGSYLSIVADTKFSRDRGFYDEPFEVEITCATSDAIIRYTTDGSAPTQVNGRDYNPASPIIITTTTCLRAMAYKPGWMSTNIDTHSYIFLKDVINQATDPQTGAQVDPQGYPSLWVSERGDYQVDPDVVGQNGTDIHNGLYAATIIDDLKSVPTVSLVMDKDDWFGSEGIYIHKEQDGTERVASIEFFDPNTEDQFQANCAIAMQGGVSGGGTSLNRWKSFKLSMRPRFKTQTDDGKPTGGPTRLNFKLFRDSPVESFNTFVLDGILNHSWLHPTYDQRNTALYVQDQYVADLHNAMGGYSPHGSYAHIYINGLYWGMYYIHERPDHAWASEIFGGDLDEYDAIKHDSGGVVNDGTGGSATTNYNAMISAANAVQSSPTSMARYEALAEMLDIDEFITYLLANWFTGNRDWPAKNWYATHRNHPDGRWRFHSWDAEHSVEASNNVGDSPSNIHIMLRGNAEYRMRFADLIHRYFFNGGVLSYPVAVQLYQSRMSQVDRAIVGESARWGDNRSVVPYTRSDWLDAQDEVLTNFFPERSDKVFGWLKGANLYPNIDAPVFRINGSYKHGGQIYSNDRLSMSASGSIWYTLDGTDPRLPGGAVNSSHAIRYSGSMSLTASIHVKARVLSGSTWSALNEATFAVGPVTENLRITEIMYHPQDPNTEFIELQNIGTERLSLNLVRFTNGINFAFPNIELERGEYVLVVEDISAFNAKYSSGLSVAGQYSGSLSNSGERIELQDAAGRIIHDFNYKDGWYDTTDGEGFSLIVKDPVNTDPQNWSDKNNWRPSANVGGSPGSDDAE